MKTIFRIFAPALTFSYVCACGWFIGWIGGMEPFTPNAGFLSFVTLSLATAAAALSIDISRKGY